MLTTVRLALRFLRLRSRGPLAPLTGSTDIRLFEPERFSNDFAFYSCPIINPPSQRHLFENKMHNLRLAAATMQNLVLRPKDIFSFWHRVGPPDERNGFREGATFIRRRVSTAVGGGLCQLSGLLYNLALLSGCKILERHPHSIDAYGSQRYIPLGRDATVAYPHKDIAFQNIHPFPILLKLQITESSTSGWICATRPKQFEVEIRVSSPSLSPSPVIETVDESLTQGSKVVEQGFGGKEVTVHRLIRYETGEARPEFLSNDIYLATATEIRIGKKCLPAGAAT